MTRRSAPHTILRRALLTTRRRTLLTTRRRALLVPAIAWATVASGCSSPPVDPDGSPSPGLFKDHTVVVGGMTRRYDYYVPTGMDSSASPLVILLHGGGSSSDDLTGESGHETPYRAWMDVAEAEKLIVAYPEGTVNPLGGLGWNDCRADATTNPSVDDVAFIDAVIDELSTTFAIDPDRVYASGTSNGGHMSLRLALELPHKIAAVAPVVAAMPAVPCAAPTQPVSVLFMNGTADPLHPYGGGEVAPDVGGRGTVISTAGSVSLWVDFLQAAPTPVATSFPDLDTGDGSTVRSFTHSGGVEGTEVVLYEVVGGGHTEPSIAERYPGVVVALLGRQNHDIEMAHRIWDFFEGKTR